MIYTGNEEYKIKFYKNKKGDSPVLYYICKQSDKERAKINKYIEFFILFLLTKILFFFMDL